MTIKLGDKVAVKATGATGSVVHLYTDDAGKRIAFVRLDSSDRAARFAVDSLGLPNAVGDYTRVDVDGVAVAMTRRVDIDDDDRSYSGRASMDAYGLDND